MSERCHDDCGTGEGYCEIRLFQYSIVSIKRGEERVLEYNQKLVKDPMNECEFDAWVILDYAERNPIPPGERQYLRVWSQLLKVWEKQPLHYPQRQLEVLQEIANSLGGHRYGKAGAEGGAGAGA